MKMNKEQQKEWAEAQKIAVTVDLVEAAKKHLKFLAAVDQNRYLYEDRALQQAIYRYNAFWLPLLAKHMESRICEGPLVVPLDCEWIWHCHRLNPIRYKVDCQKLYGKILTNRNVISSVQATPKTNKTREIWNKMYPEEPYELDLNRALSDDVLQNNSPNEKFTSYDLVSAVKRQISFAYQMSRPHMTDELFLREAEARYKGFLHLVRTNQKLGIARFCVPTHDVDLMWHTHQLHPYYYCTDMIKLIGTVLQHDDTDSDRSKGGKLDNGFSETTQQFEETFGKKYWKAGAMYRGSTPTPVTEDPCKFIYEGKEINLIENFENPMQFSGREIMEVFLEFEEIKNLPEDYKDNLRVSFSKKNTDKFFNTRRSLKFTGGLPASEEKQVAYLQCEPTGEFLFEIESNSSKVLGSCSLSLEELLGSRSQLSVDKWLLVEPVSGLEISEPILLHVFVSFTPPTPTPQVFHLAHFHGSETYVTDDNGKVLFNLQMRNADKDAATKCTPQLLKEVHYVTDSGENRLLAEFIGENWVVRGTNGLFVLQKNPGNDGHLFELVGNKMVKLYPGRKLEFQPQQNGNRRCEQDFITAVEFSKDHPYGRAIALFDLKLGTVKAVDEWIVLPSITLGILLSDGLSQKRYTGFADAQCNVCNKDKPDAFVRGGTKNMVKSSHCSFCFTKANVGVLNDTEVNRLRNSDDLCKETSNGGKCGGGKCAGGKCGGGQCGGGTESVVMSSHCGYCIAVPNDTEVNLLGNFDDLSTETSNGGKCGGGTESVVMSSLCGYCIAVPNDTEVNLLGNFDDLSTETSNGGKCGGGTGGKCGGGTESVVISSLCGYCIAVPNDTEILGNFDDLSRETSNGCKCGGGTESVVMSSLCGYCIAVPNDTEVNLLGNFDDLSTETSTGGKCGGGTESVVMSSLCGYCIAVPNDTEVNLLGNFDDLSTETCNGGKCGGGTESVVMSSLCGYCIAVPNDTEVNLLGNFDDLSTETSNGGKCGGGTKSVVMSSHCGFCIAVPNDTEVNLLGNADDLSVEMSKGGFCGGGLCVVNAEIVF